MNSLPAHRFLLRSSLVLALTCAFACVHMFLNIGCACLSVSVRGCLYLCLCSFVCSKSSQCIYSHIFALLCDQAPYPSFASPSNASSSSFGSFVSNMSADHSTGTSHSLTRGPSAIAWDIRPRSNSRTANANIPVTGSPMRVRAMSTATSTGAPSSLGSVYSLLAREEHAWAGIDRHIVLVGRKEPHTLKLLEDHHESPVKQLVSVRECVWSASYDKLCMWSDAGESMREIIRGQLPSVTCLLPLGAYVHDLRFSSAFILRMHSLSTLLAYLCIHLYLRVKCWCFEWLD